jgi:hypothetical protein
MALVEAPLRSDTPTIGTECGGRTVLLPASIRNAGFLIAVAVFAVLASRSLGGAQEQPLVYVRHVEQLAYPPLGSAAGIQGVIKIKLKISPEGKVIDAVLLSDEGTPKPHPMLVTDSIALIKTWTFGCFNCAAGVPYEHVFTFVYKLEGAPRFDRTTKVVMDFPNEVTVISQPMECDHCGSVAPGVSLIDLDRPGVGVLVAVGSIREALEEGRPPATTREYTDSFPDCAPRTEITWPETGGNGNVSAFLRNGVVFQVESATRRYSTIEGITVNSSPSQVKRHYKALEAYVLDPSGGQESDFHDLNYWVSRKEGIAFEFAYSPKNRRRFVSKVIVFAPGTEFFPEGCIPPTQRWFDAPPYTFFDK